MESLGSILAGLMLMLGVTADPDLIISAQYDTEFGPLILERHPDTGHVGGFYEDFDGLITGHSDRKGGITGYWVQERSDRQCATERLGSRHWGRVTWTASADGLLVGRWSYCEEKPGVASTWNGTRRTGDLFP